VLEELLDALVDEPQARLHAQDRLADHPEAEVPRLDQPGVDRADGDLVDTGALDRDEGVLPRVGDQGGHGARVTAHRVPPVGPVLVEHQPAFLWVVQRLEAEQVGHLPLEATALEREPARVGTQGWPGSSGTCSSTLWSGGPDVNR